MRHAGLDYGARRIGIALSDEEGRIAFPKTTIRNTGSGTLRDLATFIRKERVSTVVVGLPSASDGADTAQSREVREFAGELAKRISVPIEFESERLTTRIAARSTGKAHVDAASAALILQAYLDKRKISNFQ